MTPEQIKKAVREVQGYLQDAVGDMAYEMTGEGSGFLDDNWKRKINKAKRNGVSDICGWLADELYNDPDTLSDLMGDRISDLVHGNEEDFQKVLDEMEKNAYPGMKKACKSLRR